jgi:hypothetical protein
MIGLLIAAQSVGALPLGRPQGIAPTSTSTSTIAYQGRLADANNQPLTGNYGMEFRLYDVSSGGTSLWSETWTGSNSVSVSDGLFNIMLGSLNPIPQSVITGHSSLWLGITVGSDTEMVPRVQLGSVPFAVQALTVPDGSITSAKLDNNLSVNGNLNIGGNVGIGTATPQNKLEVSGSIAGGSANLDLLGASLAGYLDNIGGIGLLIGWNRSRGGRETDFINFGGLGPGQGDGGFRFYVADTSDTNPVLTIESNGNVGIGTTNPGSTLTVNGNFTATGTKSAVVNTADYGQRKLYAFEQATNRFGDEGKTRLVSGVARVDVDPVFLQTIEGEYLVHVTPYGDASLYVAEIGRDYFVVRARAGDPDVAFAWRLRATRKGYADVRLEEFK